MESERESFGENTAQKFRKKEQNWMRGGVAAPLSQPPWQAGFPQHPPK
jgi:hypothetical protein